MAEKINKLSVKLIVLALVSLVMMSCYNAMSGESEVIQLQKGQQKTIEAENLTRVAVANPEIADVRILSGGKELLVIGLSEGATDLTTWDTKGKTTVISILVGKGAQDLAKEIKGLLADIEGVEVKVVGDRVVLDGKVLTKEDKDRIDTIAEAYGEVLNLVTISVGPHHELMENMLEKNIAMPGVKAKVVGEKVILEGIVFSKDDAEKAEKIAATYFPSVVNLLKIKEAMVEIDLHFAQIDTSKGKDVGSNIMKSLSLSGSMAGGKGIADATTYGVALNALSNLNYLVSRGAGQILAKPHLSTQSGKKGKFHSGGEMGYKVQSESGTGMVEWKEYGLLMEIEPVVHSTGDISNHISIEVSAPVAVSGTEDMAFTKFTTETDIICKIGESVVISGLVESLKNKFKEKTPVLGDIPILSMFFSHSKDSTTNKELVVVVTPTVPTLAEAREHVPGSADYKEIIKKVTEDNKEDKK